MKKTKTSNNLANTKTVIAVSGYAQAGKDTFADAVEEALGQGILIKRFKFAEPLRTSIKLAFDYLGIKVSPWTESQKDKKKLRPLFITLGEYARGEDLDIFAKIAASEVESSLKADCEIAIITDLRYSNENRVLSELCNRNGYKYHRVHIVRVGNKPASEVEEQSVALLLNDGIDIQYVANDGDLNMIKSFAKECVSIINKNCLHSSMKDVT